MGNSLLEIIFWACVLTLCYSYIGYPFVLTVINKVFYTLGPTSEEMVWNMPAVSIIIAAYNEEKVIGKKIENCLGLDYPAGLLDVWIASDGSSDKTNDIVKAYAGKDKRIHLLELPRTGKSGVINKVMTSVKNEIVVFSDANPEFMQDALKNLAKHFQNNEVGCVCGRLVYRNPGGVVTGEGESAYWRYETALKKMESRIGYVAGANGAIYAIRRELFEPLDRNTINDDFEISMKIVIKGFKCIYEENAIAYEDVAPDMESEFNRHIRDGAGHYIAVLHLLGLLNPLLGIRAFIYWSHRVLRWSAPFILVLVFVMNILLLDKGFYRVLFIPHFGFYLLAVIGLINIKNRILPFFIYLPFYFCNLNLALLLGYINAASGKQQAMWERTERAG